MLLDMMLDGELGGEHVEHDDAQLAACLINVPSGGGDVDDDAELGAYLINVPCFT
jgi:hypothetical protein